LIFVSALESLRLLGPDQADWVPPTDGVDHNVAIVGAGQSGVTIAYALRRAGVGRVTLLDESPTDAAVGSWAAKARMLRLRTAKTLVGPELGNPALGFRAWYEARHGSAAYDAFTQAATADWAGYLVWFRARAGVTARHGTRLTRLEPDAGGRFRLHLRHDGTETVEVARKVILANGVEGIGGPDIPTVLADLPPDRYAHTGHQIDFAALAGRSVAVLGAAASAFDAAAAALEAGAAEVHLFCRRPELPIPPAGAKPPSQAIQDNFHRLPDAVRWRRRWAVAQKGGTAPLDSVLRATAYPNFRIHLAAPWHRSVFDGDAVEVTAADGQHRFDFVIAGTGYQQDPRTRPELAAIAEHIRLWRDVYDPPAELRSERLGSFPYVGDGYQLTGDAPWLADIHVFNTAATQSFGMPVGDVPCLRAGVPRLVDAVVRDFVLADLDRPQPPAPAAPSLLEHYEHAVWQPEPSTV
jgi:FAD-dependent urate hydroxylase